MQISRIIVRFAALVGLALALTISSATIAGAQYEGGYEGEYEGEEDCPPGYEGTAGYEGCGEGTDPGATPGGDTAAPPPSTGGSTLPDTGGVAVLGLAGATAIAGLALRRLIRS